MYFPSDNKQLNQLPCINDLHSLIGYMFTYFHWQIAHYHIQLPIIILLTLPLSVDKGFLAQ